MFQHDWQRQGRLAAWGVGVMGLGLGGAEAPPGGAGDLLGGTVEGKGGGTGGAEVSRPELLERAGATSSM